MDFLNKKRKNAKYFFFSYRPTRIFFFFWLVIGNGLFFWGGPNWDSLSYNALNARDFNIFKTRLDQYILFLYKKWVTTNR